MPSNAFIHRGVSRILLLPAVASLMAPTRAEINAGVNLSSSLAGVGGFALDNAVNEVVPVGSAFVEQVPGVFRTTGPCTLTLYDNLSSAAVRAACAPGFVRYVLLLPYGDVAGRRCEVWTTKIAAASDTWENGVALYRVLFAASVFPTQNAVVPA